jgi:hypothetical protein
LRRGGFSIPVKTKPEKVGPEEMPHFWSPTLAGVRTAPEWFKEELERFDPTIKVTWNPIIERWQVWMPAPTITFKFCRGWRLLFIHQGPDGGYLPLDDRLFARLYHASAAKWGSGKQYFDRLAAEFERDRAKAEAAARQVSLDRGIDFWKTTQISVSGCGKSTGSKFSEYLS